jgi:hypothetical protein
VDPQTARPGPAEGREEALAVFSRQLVLALRIDRPLPLATVERAASDPLFLHLLILERDQPEALARRIAEPVGRSRPKWTPEPTGLLLRRAIGALARWAAAGFGRVEEAVAERRRAACLACPELRDPSGHPVHRLAGAGDSRVCGLCSCAVDRKIWLPTEACPAPSPDDPSRNRWDEPAQ